MKSKNSSVVLVFNDAGELALQLRGAKDSSYPSHWDFSAAGGIEANEDPVAAATRELKEEIGIDGNVEFVKDILYEDELGQDLLHIYTLKNNGPFSPDRVEVDDIQFFTFEQIAKMIQNKEKFHPEFLFLWKSGFIQSLKAFLLLS